MKNYYDTELITNVGHFCLTSRHTTQCIVTRTFSVDRQPVMEDYVYTP